MNLLSNNLTFAVVTTDESWRTDLTIRFCEYFSNKINGPDFTKKIIFPASIDEAIEQCTTEYLLIQGGGHITFKKSFFDKLEQIARRSSDIVVGHVVLADDYIVFDPRCLFVNVPLWAKNGKPTFKSRNKEGPSFKVSIPTPEKSRPGQIVVSGTERVFVPGVCGEAGADMAIKQLDMFGTLNSLVSELSPEDSHYLSTASAYHEIHTETIYENLYLAPIKKQVFALDRDDMSNIKMNVADIIVAPAQGLKAMSLYEYYGAKKIIVYDNNPRALDLQRLIFSIQSAMTYADIMQEFIRVFPNVPIADNWKGDQHSVVVPLPKHVEVEYKLVDLISYQAEDMIKAIPIKVSMAIDFSDIFIYPYNYYRRPLYQVQGIFGEIYSLLGSRTGPTFISGFAPGFHDMSMVEPLASNKRFEWVPPPPPAEGEEPPEAPELFWKPPTSPQLIEKSLVMQTLQQDAPKVVSKIPEQPTPFVEAKKLGYTQSYQQVAGQEHDLTILSKMEVFDEFIAIFEYQINEVTGAWKFMVGKKGTDKRVEFSNGLTIENFVKHLNMTVKINPKTASKYF